MSGVDLSCDLGESFGTYTIGRDEEVIAYISSANVRCGFHAGDPCVTDHTVHLVREKGVSIGTHPGFPDLVGFSRRNVNITPTKAKAYMKYQIGVLDAFCVSSGVPFAHVKPHGALYNMATKDMKLAVALTEAVYEVDPELIFLGLSGSRMLRAAQQVDLTCAGEILTGRAYNAGGSLVARGAPDAMIHSVDECMRRVTGMAKDNVVTTVTGEQISLRPQSVCVRSDSVETVEFVKHIRESLTKEGTEVVDLRACTEWQQDLGGLVSGR